MKKGTGKKRLNMQKDTAKQVIPLALQIRGHLNEAGNLINFHLGNGVEFAVYRNQAGQWEGRLTGLKRGDL